MTVLDNVTTSCEPYSLGNYARDLVAPVPPELSVEARIAIDEFHLGSELARRPDELSYGDRKVAAIVRAVAMPSKLLLLDEPTAGLDTVESRKLGVLVQEFASSRGVAVLLVEATMSIWSLPFAIAYWPSTLARGSRRGRPVRSWPAKLSATPTSGWRSSR